MCIKFLKVFCIFICSFFVYFDVYLLVLVILYFLEKIIEVCGFFIFIVNCEGLF